MIWLKRALYTQMILLASTSLTFFERTGPNTKKNYSIILIESTLINATCEKKECLAYKSKASQTIKPQQDKDGFAISPLSTACLQAEGKTFYLNDLKLNQYEFCRFKDSSYIASRNLLK